MPKSLNHSSLHHYILKHLIDFGHAPNREKLSAHFGVAKPQLDEALLALQDYHGVVLHPHNPEVWVIHPFSTAPTNFLIKSANGLWWGNCAWCSLGAAALLQTDLSITTTLAAHDRQVVISIENGEVVNQGLLVHFPIPMKNAWDNVMYTCSNMLVFDNEKQIDDWCKRHDMNKGDVQPLEKIWHFAKDWYGNHLDPEWNKWTVEEAKALFTKHELTHPVWDLGASCERF